MIRSNIAKPIRTLAVLCFLCLTATTSDETDGQDDAPGSAASSAEAGTKPARAGRRAFRLQVKLPLTGADDVQLRQSIERFVSQVDPASTERSLLLLDFRSGADGAQATQYERALALARYLAGDRLKRIKTVAYVGEDVTGHGVLPVIACEQIIMAADAKLGAAGVDESFIDGAVLNGYKVIASRRRTIPWPIVRGMLDPQLTVVRLDTESGIEYTTSEEVPEVAKRTAIRSKTTLVRTGDLAELSGRQMRLELGLITHLAEDLPAVAAALKVPLPSLEEGRPSGAWDPALARITGPINHTTVAWTIKRLDERIRRGANLIIIDLESGGGELSESLRLAQFLAEQDPQQVKTVAIVNYEARADAGLIALACHDLYMAENALLGGPGALVISKQDRTDVGPAIKALAQSADKDWSLMMGMIAPDLTIHQYVQRDGERPRLFCAEERDAIQGNWKQGPELSVLTGVKGLDAHSLGLAADSTGSLRNVYDQYGLEKEPEPLTRNWAHAFVEALASTGLSRALLFMAFFMLMSELSSPGLGVPGFISALCFLLFFWSHFLDGTAGWLEVLMFVTGVVFLILEIAVIPGFGIFGVGGLMLIIGSILLASQTFVWPQNDYQVDRIVTSLYSVIWAGGGVIAAVVVLRYCFPHTPFFRYMRPAVLEEEAMAAVEQRERLTHYEYLVGRRGVAETRLAPSGKARIGDDVVSVICDSELLDKGTPVEVVEVRGNQIRVDRVASDNLNN